MATDRPTERRNGPVDGMSTQDVADLIGVSQRRVRALIASGRLRACKIGPMHVVSRADALALALTARPPGRPRARK